MSAPYGFLADLTLVVHGAFVCFVGLGGLLVLRWPRLAWVHLPAVLWAVAVEWLNLVCPLTPWEQRLRELAGQAAYQGDFVGHYLLPLLYPQSLSRSIQIALGVLVIVINGAIYAVWWYRWRR